MKDLMLSIIERYLLVFPEEENRQRKFIDYLKSHADKEVVDWNNFDGHVVAGGFVYAKEDKKFLVLYHNDLKMYLYPGGHVDKNDVNPLSASRREVSEETGLTELEQLILDNDELIPIDIDTHKIAYNERLQLPEHYHFEFRYFFTIDRIEDISIDTEELSNYQWIDIEELRNDVNYGRIAKKIEKVLAEENTKKL